MTRSTIEGIGDRQSGGAVMSGRNRQGVVFFRPWKTSQGPVSKELLRVLLPAHRLSSVAMRESKKIVEGAAYRFALDLYPAHKGTIRSGELRGKLRRLKGLEALAAADAQVSQRVVVRDRRLGKLVREPRQTCFAGTLRVLGRRCELYVWGEVAKASALFGQLKPKLASLPRSIAGKLIGLANKWRPDGARPLTERRLAAELEATELSFDKKSRKLTLSFNCGEIFTDHGVTATLSADGKLSDVHIQ